MKKLPLIGVHGPLDGGKDTAASFIIDWYSDRGYIIDRYAFARPIKKACELMFGFSQQQIEDRVSKEAIDPFWGFSPRKAMQLLGTEFGRQMLRDDVWIKRAELELENSRKNGHGLVITDVRFENEASWIRSVENSYLIYIKVPDLQKDQRYQHASEAGIKFDETTDILVVNNKKRGLESFHSSLESILSTIEINP